MPYDSVDSPDQKVAGRAEACAQTDTSLLQDYGATDTALTLRERRRTSAEIWIVLGLSMGQSAVYAIVNIIARLTAETRLGDQTATLNPSRSVRPLLDLTYQVLGIAFALMPVVLALYLLSSRGQNAGRRIGLVTGRAWRDTVHGIGLAALIGVPGLGFYLLGRALGITVHINPAALNDVWWAIPVLLMSAAMNSLLEEIIAVGYLMTRLQQLAWSVPAIIVASALLRGSYHLYQGIGPFIGNVIMGVVFAWYYHRTRRVAPLVIAHFAIDVVAFVGYTVLPDSWLQSLGVM